MNLANTKDNWYRAAQGVYVFSKTNNTKRHIGNELDIVWTHMFMDGKVSFQAAYAHLWVNFWQDVCVESARPITYLAFKILAQIPCSYISIYHAPRRIISVGSKTNIFDSGYYESKHECLTLA